MSTSPGSYDPIGVQPASQSHGHIQGSSVGLNIDEPPSPAPNDRPIIGILTLVSLTDRLSIWLP